MSQHSSNLRPFSNTARLRRAYHGLLCTSVLPILLTIGAASHATELAPVAINGTQLTVVQWRALEQQIGTRIVPGNYLLNAGGCWTNLSNGTSGCLGQGGTDVHSRHGSGSRGADGSWNHWSNAAGGAVGGTADGCIYTSFGWSNC